MSQSMVLHKVQGAAQQPFPRGSRPDSKQKRVWLVQRQMELGTGAALVLFALLAFLHPAFLILVGLIGISHIAASTTGVCLMEVALKKCPWNRAIEMDEFRPEDFLPNGLNRF